IQSPLHQIAHFTQFRGLFLKGPDELLTNDPPLGLRVRDARKFGQEPVFSMNMYQGNMEVVAKGILHLSSFILAHQPVSMKMQVSLSPTALYVRRAATAESTPPDRPQITQPAPTCSLIRSVDSSIMDTGVQVGARSQTLNRKFFNIS